MTAAVVFIFLGFVVAWLGYQTPRQGTERMTDLGNFGSYLQGTTASFWSLAGVFLIVATFLTQQRQLEGQDQQFTIQNASINRRNFESSFFQLLNLHNQLASAMVLMETDPGTLQPHDIRGRDCFQHWYEDFRRGGHGFQLAEDGTVLSVPITMSEKWWAFYEQYQGALGHYFRNLYHLFKFVKNSDVEEKRRYTSLARAQLSQYELALLFYNCLSPAGEKFKPLVEEFGLLENLNQDLLIKPEEDPKLYDPRAFE